MATSIGEQWQAMCIYSLSGKVNIAIEGGPFHAGRGQMQPSHQVVAAKQRKWLSYF
jgi:hypothetical protein